MSKKIIFFDIDGTLYTRETGVPDSTIEAIDRLVENGHIPLFCTGRTKCNIDERFTDMPIYGMVAGGGTYVEYQKRTLFEYLIPKQELERIEAVTKTAHYLPLYEGKDTIYFNPEDVKEGYGVMGEAISEHMASIMEPFDWNHARVNKLCCGLTDESDFGLLDTLLKEQYHVINHDLEGYVEIMPRCCTKASGAEILLKELGLEQSDAYAFGDSKNDLEVLQYVKYGIAMGNAYPDVLAQAPYRTKAIGDDGIYYALKEFGLI